jgi:hypothetical protein
MNYVYSLGVYVNLKKMVLGFSILCLNVMKKFHILNRINFLNCGM